MGAIARTADGDAMLSAFERRLWGLSHACLRRFGCPVTHRLTPGDRAARLDRTIEMFVPASHPGADEVMAYIQRELAEDAYEGSNSGDGAWIPGSRVTIRQVSDVPAYRDRVDTEIARQDLIYAVAAGRRGRTRG